MGRSALRLALVVLLAAGSAAAQTEAAPRFEAAGGYSLLHTRTVQPSSFNLQGGSASLAVNVNDWLGFVADAGHYRNSSFSPAGFGLNITSVMFGPRVSYRRFQHFTVFAQQLIGLGRAGGTLYTLGFAAGTAAPGPVNGFAMATGGGLDYNITRHLAVRAAQAEWLYTSFPNGAANRQDYLRVTFGAVLRFGH